MQNPTIPDYSRHFSQNGSRVRLYRLRPEPFARLQARLDQVQSFWTAQLGAFKDHVERNQKGDAP